MNKTVLILIAIAFGLFMFSKNKEKKDLQLKLENTPFGDENMLGGVLGRMPVRELKIVNVAHQKRDMMTTKEKQETANVLNKYGINPT